METIAFFDIAKWHTGFCVGTGETAPHADYFTMKDHGDHVGGLGVAYWQALDQLHARFGFTVAGYEKAILLPNDTLEDLLRLYGLAMILPTWCEAKGIPCWRETVQAVKRETTGNPNAKKPEIAARIEHAGIVLPTGPGRLDAADAASGWLIGLRTWNPSLSPLWDRRVHRANGAPLI